MYPANYSQQLAAQQAHPIPLADAARVLGVGSKTLFKLLRERQVLGANNVALPTFIKARLFVIHNRRFSKSGVRQWYQVSLITPMGLSWLEQQLGLWMQGSDKKTTH